MSKPTPSLTTALGRHILLELYDCPEDKLRRPAHSEATLLAAAQAMGATVIESRFHAFSPHGVSGVVIIAESHLTVHTWPEHGYAAVDVFSCGQLDFQAGLEVIRAGFSCGKSEEQHFARGSVFAQSSIR